MRVLRAFLLGLVIQTQLGLSSCVLDFSLGAARCSGFVAVVTSFHRAVQLKSVLAAQVACMQPPPLRSLAFLTQWLCAEGDAVQNADAAGRGRRHRGPRVAGGLHRPRHLARRRRAAVARHPPHHHARPQPRRLPRQRERRHLGHPAAARRRTGLPCSCGAARLSPLQACPLAISPPYPPLPAGLPVGTAAPVTRTTS